MNDEAEKVIYSRMFRSLDGLSLTEFHTDGPKQDVFRCCMAPIVPEMSEANAAMPAVLKRKYRLYRTWWRNPFHMMIEYREVLD